MDSSQAPAKSLTCQHLQLWAFIPHRVAMQAEILSVLRLRKETSLWLIPAPFRTNRFCPRFLERHESLAVEAELREGCLLPENWLDAHRDWSGSPDCNPPVQTLIPEVCVSFNYECEPTFTYKSRFSLPQSSESQVKQKKSCFRETFGQNQGPASSAFEDSKRQTNYWQCWISQVALKCSVSMKVCSQMKQQSIEQFWHVVNYEREQT